MLDVRAVLLVGLGSFAGGLLRFIFVILIDRKAQGSFPWSVLLVNALGSFAIGLAASLYPRFGWNRDDAVPLLLSVGVLGGFTTFSTFSLQMLRLLQTGHFAQAALYAFGSVGACLIAVYFGAKLGAL